MKMEEENMSNIVERALGKMLPKNIDTEKALKDNKMI
jgi:ribosomal protein L13